MKPRLNDLRLSSIDLRQAIRLNVEHIYNGAINRKDAIAFSAPVLDLPADEQAVEGLRRLLRDSLDNPLGFAFDTLPDPQGPRSAAMRHCREVLLALTGLMRWRGCGKSRDLARRFVRTIEAATRETGTFPAPTRILSRWTWRCVSPNTISRMLSPPRGNRRPRREIISIPRRVP